MNKITPFVFVLSLVILSACGPVDKLNQKNTENIIEDAIKSQTGGQVDVDSEDGEVTIKTSDGQTHFSSSGQAAIPDGFPPEMIIAEDAKIIISTSSENNISISYTTLWQQTDLRQKYLDIIPALGWKKVTEVDTGNGYMVSFSKDTAALMITIGPNSDENKPGNSIVSIVLTSEQ